MIGLQVVKCLCHFKDMGQQGKHVKQNPLWKMCEGLAR